ncbi:MAG TPA: hypothetical protein EYG86_09495 [Crocinitomicaceae bacterium]|nr:hypothetical protein [Crocinitomicaceae bacterium]
MNNIKNLLSIALVALLFASLTSCDSGDGTKNAKDALSSFLNENDNVVAFGNAQLKDILNKADYANIPKAGKLLGSEMSSLEKMIDFDTPVYYALEGPFEKGEGPASTYGFLQLKDNEAFVDELTKRGFDVVKKGDIQFTEDGDFALGFIEDIAIFVISNRDEDSEKMIADAFKKIKGEMSGGKVDEILDQEGDMILGMNVASLYNTSNTDLSKLSKVKQEELKEMVEDSYVQTVFKFEDGAGIIETKNFFSKTLESKMFFNSDNSAPLLAKLGSGTPRLGISINLDMKKMQSFMDDYSPETMDNLAKSMGPMVQGALMFSGKDGLASLFNGQLGAVMVGDVGDGEGMIPDFNAFVGMTKKGQDLASMMGEMDLGFGEFKTDKDGLSLRSGSDTKMNGASKGLNLPLGAENFGKSGVSFFVNLDGVDLDEFELEGGSNVLKVVKYITFDYDENGGRLYIKAKKGQENVLKQAMDVLIDEFASEISKMSI